MNHRSPISLKEFGELFRLQVDISDYSIKEVCDYAGIRHEEPSRWRKGKGRPPYYNEVALIANILGKPVEYFIYGATETIEIERCEYEQAKQDADNLLYAIAQQKAKKEEEQQPENRQN